MMVRGWTLSVALLFLEKNVSVRSTGLKVMETCSKGILNLKKEEIEKITETTEDVSADSIDSIDWSLYLPRVTFTG